MTLSVLALLSVVLVPLALGLAILRACGWPARGEPLLAFAFAYLTGHLGIALLEAMWLVCGAPLDARLQAPLAVVLALGLCLATRERAPSPAPLLARRKPALARGLLAVLALLIALHVVAAVRAAGSPVMLGEGDEAWNWALKAKLLFDKGSLGAEYAERLRAYTGAGEDYPLLNPLLQVWTFAHAGRILHVENRIPMQLAMPALLCLVCAALQRTLRWEITALLLLLLGTAGASLALSPWAGSDVLCALALAAAVEGAMRWRTSGEPAWFRLTALVLGFLVWTKNEGQLYALVLVPLLLTGARHEARAAEWAWLLVPAGIAAATVAFNVLHGFGPMHLEAHALERLQLGRIGTVLAFAWRRTFLLPGAHGGVFMPLALLSLLAPRLTWCEPVRRLTALLWILVAALLAVYVLSPRELEWNLVVSTLRVFFQLVPTIVLWLGQVLTRVPALARAEEGEPGGMGARSAA